MFVNDGDQIVEIKAAFVDVLKTVKANEKLTYDQMSEVTKAFHQYGMSSTDGEERKVGPPAKKRKTA